MGILEGKRAIVTGAGQGVGRGIALAFASEGCAIAAAGRTESKLHDVVKEIETRGARGIPVVCDVGDAEQIEHCVQVTVEQFGGIDILVNNAQQVPLGRLLDVSDKAFRIGFDTGPLATLRFMRACHPHLMGGGVIVNLGTGAALRPDPVGYGAYTAVKEATRSLTRDLARLGRLDQGPPRRIEGVPGDRPARARRGLRARHRARRGGPGRPRRGLHHGQHAHTGRRPGLPALSAGRLE